MTARVNADARWLRLTSGGAPVYVPAADVAWVRAVRDARDGGPTLVRLADGECVYADQSVEAVMAALGAEIVDVAGGAS